MTEKNILIFEKNQFLNEKIDCIKTFVNLEKESLNLIMKNELDDSVHIFKNDEEIVETLLKNSNLMINSR